MIYSVSNFKRMHLIGGTLSLLCLLWNLSKCIDLICNDWREGIEITAGLVIGGYFAGCLIGMLVNFCFLWKSNSNQ